MTARTHDAIAFASLITIAAFNPPESLNLITAGSAIVANIVGATLPDIDQATNRLWDFLPGGDYLGKVLGKLFMGHRNLTHSLLGLFLVFKGLEFILPRVLNPQFVDANIVFAAIMIGYISHLASDSVTKEGLPLLFPSKLHFGFPPLKFMRITTGKWIENLIILPGTAIYIFWFIGRNQEMFINLLHRIAR